MPPRAQRAPWSVWIRAASISLSQRSLSSNPESNWNCRRSADHIAATSPPIIRRSREPGLKAAALCPSCSAVRRKKNPNSGRRMPKKERLQVGDQSIEVSNLEKIFYPAARFTKGHVIDYYIQGSQYILPHLEHRPVTLKRFPDGIHGKVFYEKD